ncbi:PhnD/SsuA/transferrin family substrate-binding protein [Candidatus Bipolaricaulota bacterium]|nr:PhnD/SsuA/transferrin family substrate-binding protein [Candidatus Bipolaricaulota bacterium]
MPSYAALVEAMIAAKGDTMACPTTEQYAAITNVNPGVHARLAAVRYGYHYYFSTIYVPREAGCTSVEDLRGKIWIYNDPGSTSGHKIPRLLFEKLGITFAGTVESGGHTASVIALLEGQGDFATGSGSPPIKPEHCTGSCLHLCHSCLEAGDDPVACAVFVDKCLAACEARWEYGFYPELWVWDPWKDELMPEELRGIVKDVRYSVSKATKAYGTYWDIIQKIGILDTIGPIPNGCLAFSAGFPKDIEDRIVEPVKSHIKTARGRELWGDPNFYEWDDVVEIDDSFYDPYRELVGYPIPPRE